MNYKKNMLIAVAFGTMPLLVSAQTYDFESVNGCGLSSYASCTTAADGWTPFVVGASNSIIRIMNRNGTLTPPGACNGTNWFPNTVNPESWEMSFSPYVADTTNKRYIAFQVYGNGTNGIELGLTRSIPSMDLVRVYYHVTGRLANATSPAIEVHPWVSADDLGGAPCTQLPSVSWTATAPSGTPLMVTLNSSALTWQERSANLIQSGVTRIWVRLMTETPIASGAVYKFYFDDIWLQTAEGLLINVDELFEDGVEQSTGINSAEATSAGMRLMPNPAGERTVLMHGTCDPRSSTIDLLNTVGSVVKRITPLASGATELDVSDLAGGSYIVRFTSGQSAPQVLKLVREGA